MPGIKKGRVGACNSQLRAAINRVLEQCIQCNICVKECSFLQQNGDPLDLATLFQTEPSSTLAFSCSLCGLCTALCPKDVDPAALFLHQRQNVVHLTALNYKGHQPLRNYEKMGSSKILSWYGLPEHCDTIFFPGCALPGTRSQRVLDVISQLQVQFPSLGVVLDCCTKPSHDLGDETYFRQQFKRILDFLNAKAIRNILVACPNCYRMFKEYGTELKVEMIYERLEPQPHNPPQRITIHDPCGVRFQPHIHHAVRHLLQRSNATITEMKHHGEKTLCCGEGGGVGFLHQELAQSWTTRRRDEAGNQKVITYCAGCTHYLGQQMDASHLLDLLFEPHQTMAGLEKVASSPFTYWHRFRLKHKLQKLLLPMDQGSLA
ncbi:MAG: (Fe-S)-binding protein [Desulfobulbaceae bacterium]|nr:(Fe-S)-binding protein [Desulfobulbaceae bacterium]